MLKKAGYQKFIFEEAKILAELDERFSAKGEGASVAIKMANNLAYYPIDDAERVEFIYEDIDPSAYESLLSYLRPNNMLAILTGKGIETTDTEKWYSAKYSYEEGNNELYELISSPPLIEELKLPVANQFMPTSTDIIPLTKKDKKDYSKLIYKYRRSQVPHKLINISKWLDKVNKVT